MVSGAFYILGCRYLPILPMIFSETEETMTALVNSLMSEKGLDAESVNKLSIPDIVSEIKGELLNI